ncbi:MAG: hypothetical protein ACOYT4_03560 [Nanoarchaeota archaeon]
MIKKLKLKPSSRENRRYLLINEKKNFRIEKAILDYMGLLGFAKAGYIKVKSENEKIIACVTREELEKVRASLCLAGISVEKVSGTLKGLHK